MFEKAVCYQPMDYQVVFWGYTFAIKKLTWFAQVKDGRVKKKYGHMSIIVFMLLCFRLNHKLCIY